LSDKINKIRKQSKIVIKKKKKSQKLDKTDPTDQNEMSFNASVNKKMLFNL